MLSGVGERVVGAVVTVERLVEIVFHQGCGCIIGVLTGGGSAVRHVGRIDPR